MRDGQNRMMALVEANVTLPFIIFRNATEEEIATLDTGMARTFGDVTKMQGIANPTDVAAASAWWWKYENRKCDQKERATHKQLIELRDQHLNSLADAIKLVSGAKNAKVMVPKSCLTFMIAYLMEKNPIAATEFLTVFDTGIDLTVDDPIFALRRILLNNLGRRSKLAPYIVLALIMFRSGEDFPEFCI